MKLKKLLVCLISMVTMLNVFSANVVFAEDDVSSVTGVTLGDGLVATRNAAVDQQAVYNEALQRVVYWRKDALNDTSIKFEYQGVYYPVREYLAKSGISESEYLNPKWSNALERIAIQRAIEINYSFEHTRPNGTSCFTAKVDNETSWSEIIAWGTRNVTGAIDLWATEKSEYIKEVNGQNHSVTGHYTTLISPGYTYYGFGGTSSSWTGEAGYETSSTAPTNLKGNYNFEVTFSDSDVNKGVKWTGEDTISINSTENYSVTLNCNYRFSVKGAWTSSNPSVAIVDSNGNVTGVSKGTTTITLTSGGKSFTKDIKVVDGKLMYRIYNPNSGEHFYTENKAEKENLVKVGWNYEGIGWIAPTKSNTPVYRLYSGTDHHYTTDSEEKDALVKVGWKYEGIGWYSDDNKGVPLYRQFNPNVNPQASRNNSGSHNYTKSKEENDSLVKLGWREEGIGWYGVN